MKKFALALVVAFALLPLAVPTSAAMGTACSPIGSTMACVDACNNRLSCTCILSHGTGLWGCSIEC